MRAQSYIELRTFGSFQLFIGGEPLALPRHAPRRQLQLLKVLVALGGQASIERVTEVLWPDAEGDKALQSFHSALYRLRERLPENAIAVRDGRVSLDRAQVRVDALEFMAAVEDARRSFENEKPGQAIEYSERALRCYAKPFLEGEFEPSPIPAARARLHGLFLRHVERMGQVLSGSGQFEQALAVYRGALSIDPGAEEITQALMRCCAALGRHSEGLAAFETLRQTLQEQYGVEPGEAGQGLRRNLLEAARAKSAEPDASEATTPPAAPTRAQALPCPSFPERRPVTVVTSRLTGLDGLDVEEANSLVAAVKEQVHEVVTRHGGVVNHFAAEGITSLFGASPAHEDDPVRAVRAMLALHAWTRERPPLRLQSGISTGLALVSQGEPDEGPFHLTGMVAGQAAQLHGRAGSGEILLSADMRRQVADFFTLEARPPPGAPGALGAWLVAGDTPVRTRFQAAERRGLMPFVGRQAELRQVASILEECRQSGSGRLVIIRGDAGIGKSRLAYESRCLAEEQGFACQTAEVFDFGMYTGSDPLREVVRSMLGLPHDAGERARHAAIQSILEAQWVSRDREPFLFDLVGLALPNRLKADYDAMENQHRNARKRETACDLFEASARERPQLVLVEDVHWADQLTLSGLATLARATARCPAMLLLTTRLSGDPLDWGWRQTAKGAAATTIDLAPLLPADALALAHAIREVSADMAQRCVERCEGNPLFLEQLLLDAEESAGSGVPGSVQSLVLARTDRLDSKDKSALQAASVLGQRFDADALQFLIIDSEYDFRELINHALLRRDEHGYLFAHALVRDGLYQSLLHTLRRELHARAAEWFQERDPILYAEHLQRAGDARAAEAFLRATRAEVERIHFERALKLIEQGISLEPSPDTRHALLSQRGWLQRELGMLKDSIASYEMAAEIAADDRRRCAGWLGMAEAMRITDDYERCLKVLDLAEPAAAMLAAPELQSQVRFLRGCVFFSTGNGPSCLTEHRAALELARQSGNAEIEARALGGLADGYYSVGEIRKCQEVVAQCVEHAARAGYPRIEAANRLMMGWNELFFNGVDAAVVGMRYALALAERYGLWRSAMLIRTKIASMLAERGEFAESRRMLMDYLEQVRGGESPRFVAIATTELAHLEDTCGNRREANRLAREARNTFENVGSAYSLSMATGLVAMTTDSLDECKKTVAMGCHELATGSPPLHNHFYFWRFAIEAALRHRAWDLAEQYADALMHYNEAEQLPYGTYFLRRGRALAAVGREQANESLTREIRDVIAMGERLGLLITLKELREAGAALNRGGTRHEAV